MVWDYLIITLKNVKRRGVRSWLTVLGVVIGVMAVVALLMLSMGLQNAVEFQFSKLGLKSIRIIPGALRGAPSGGVSLPQGMKEKLDSMSIIDYVNPVVIDYRSLEFGREKKFFSFMGYDASLSGKGFVDLNVNMERGRFFHKNEKNAVILGNKVAHDSFKRAINLRSNVKIKGVSFRVVGILEKTGSDIDKRVYLPLQTMRDIFNIPTDINLLVIGLKEGVDTEEGARQIKVKLLRYYDKDDFAIFTPKQLLSRIQQMIGMLNFILGMIAAISLIVGSIGIMNNMFTSVLERTREIGVMKAIGARKSAIVLIFLLEAGIIGLVGGIIGLALGAAISYGVAAIAAHLGFDFLVVRLTLRITLVTLLLAFGVGALSGIAPAYRAASLKPIDALHYE